MTVKLSPVFNEETLINGIPAVGAKLFVYAAGSTTKQNSYTDSTGTVAQSNPIILNARGEPASPIWLTAGQSYKFVLSPSTDTDPPTSPIRTIDNVTGVNDTSLTVDQWISSGLTPTYISSTSFSVPGDQTSPLSYGRRLKITVSSGTVYGTITSSTYSTLTTIVVSLDSGAIDAGISQFSYGILTKNESSIPVDVIPSKINKLSASVASNALTISIPPSSNDFRSSSLSSGDVLTINSNSTISLTVPAGATLGTTNGTLNRLIVLEINNAGSVELAVVNAAGGLNLDETGLISTTAISASSNSASTIYSATARTNVPYRVAGYKESTQATAGQWATAPSLVQGAGGLSLTNALNTRKYVNMTSSRVGGTTYTNTTSQDRFALIKCAVGPTGYVQLVVDGGAESLMQNSSTPNPQGMTLSAVIPPGSSYVCNLNGSSIQTWWER